MTDKCNKYIVECLAHKLTYYGEQNFSENHMLPPANQFCEICATFPMLLQEEEEMLLQNGLKIRLFDSDPIEMNYCCKREIMWVIYSQKDLKPCIIIRLILIFDDLNSSVSFELITEQEKIEFKKIKEVQEELPSN